MLSASEPLRQGKFIFIAPLLHRATQLYNVSHYYMSKHLVFSKAM